MSIPSSYSCVWDIPSLSGHISSTYFISSDGRALSIGMQYLKKRKRCGLQLALPFTNTESNKPYCMQSIRQSPLLRPATNKLLNNLQLSITCFESSGVVENVTGTVREG